MLDKKILNCDVMGKKDFAIRVSEPYNNLVLDFLLDFSKGLRKFKKINLYPDLIYLIFWCGKNKNMGRGGKIPSGGGEKVESKKKKKRSAKAR